MNIVPAFFFGKTVRQQVIWWNFHIDYGLQASHMPPARARWRLVHFPPALHCAYSHPSRHWSNPWNQLKYANKNIKDISSRYGGKIYGCSLLDWEANCGLSIGGKSSMAQSAVSALVCTFHLSCSTLCCYNTTLYPTCTVQRSSIPYSAILLCTISSYKTSNALNKSIVCSVHL